jgi:hypothetical protein
MSPEPTRARLTRKEAADYMRVSEGTFDRHIAPEIQPVRIGRQLFYLVVDLEAWVDKQRVEPKSTTSAG